MSFRVPRDVGNPRKGRFRLWPLARFDFSGNTRRTFHRPRQVSNTYEVRKGVGRLQTPGYGALEKKHAHRGEIEISVVVLSRLEVTRTWQDLGQFRGIVNENGEVLGTDKKIRPLVAEGD